MIERRLRLTQQSEDASHLRVLCLALLLRSPTFGLERSRLLGGGLRRGLRLAFPLLLHPGGGQCRNPLPLGLGFGCAAVLRQGVMGPQELRRDRDLRLGRGVRSDRPPAGLELRERCGIRRIDPPLDVPRDRGSGCRCRARRSSASSASRLATRMR